MVSEDPIPIKPPTDSPDEIAEDDMAEDDEGSRELLRRFAGGDQAALTELVERESPRLLHRIRRRLPAALRRRVGESDILQLTALDLLVVRDRFEDRGMAAFRGMLDTIADINVARVFERETAQRRSIAAERPIAAPPGSHDGTSPNPLDQIPGSGSSPSSPLHRKERAAVLEQCFALLRESDREVIRLIDYDEVSYEEAARRLAIEPSTLHRRHSRAIARLRELLERSQE